MIYNSLAELQENNPNAIIGACLYARHSKTHRIIPFVYVACPQCNHCRWVSKWRINKTWFTGYCASCNGVRNGKENLKQIGEYIDCDGYRRVRIEPSNPFYSMANRRYILEHRLIMAQYLGRPLTSDEHVHHINGIKIDNRIENLKLTTNLEHTRDEWAELKELRTRVTQLEAEVVLLKAQLEKDGIINEW